MKFMLKIVIPLLTVTSCSSLNHIFYDKTNHSYQIHNHAARTANMLGQKELEQYHLKKRDKNSLRTEWVILDDLVSIIKMLD